MNTVTVVVENPDKVSAIGVNEIEHLVIVEPPPLLLEKEARIIKIICMFDCFSSFFIFFITNIYAPFISFIFSYFGYIGARDLNKNYTRVYLVYNYISLIGKLVFITQTSYVLYLLLDIIFQLGITLTVQSFSNKLT